MPTSLVSIMLTSSYYAVTAITTSATLIINPPMLVARNADRFGSLSFIKSDTMLGMMNTMTFRLIPKSTVSPASQLMISFPGEFDIETFCLYRQRLKCNYKLPYAGGKFRSTKCFFQKLVKTYIVIQGAFTLNVVYDFTILRLGLISTNRYYWTYPATGKFYYFTIDVTDKKNVQDTSVVTITNTDSIMMEVFTSIPIDNYLEVKDASVGRSTLYNVQFTSAAAEFMDIIFPVSQNRGSSIVNLFDFDLKTTNTNGISYAVTDVGNALGAAVVYRLFFGVP